MRNQLVSRTKRNILLGILCLFAANVHAQTNVVVPSGSAVTDGATLFASFAELLPSLRSHDERPLISCLVLNAGPSAVAGLIVSIYVNAVNLIFGRTDPHVGQEVLEAVAPPLTDCNSAPSIVFPVGRFGVLASENHRSPDFIFVSGTASPGAAVPQECPIGELTASFFRKASTAFGVPVAQASTPNGNEFFAFAFTSPSRLAGLNAIEG